MFFFISWLLKRITQNCANILWPPSAMYGCSTVQGKGDLPKAKLVDQLLPTTSQCSAVQWFPHCSFYLQASSTARHTLHCIALSVDAVCTQHGSTKSALSRDFPAIVWQAIHNFNATSLVVQLHLKPFINNNRGGNSSNVHFRLFANPTAQRRNRTWTAGTPPMMHSMLRWATSLAIFLAANKSCDGLANNHSSQNAQWVKQFKTQWNFHNLFKKGEFICSGRMDGFRKGNGFF